MNDQSQSKPGDQSQANKFEELDALLIESTDENTSHLKDKEALSENEFDALDVLIEKSGYERLPGFSKALPGKKYICPVPGCAVDWFRIGLRTPPLCEEHGVVLVPTPDER